MSDAASDDSVTALQAPAASNQDKGARPAAETDMTCDDAVPAIEGVPLRTSPGWSLMLAHLSGLDGAPPIAQTGARARMVSFKHKADDDDE